MSWSEDNGCYVLTDQDAIIHNAMLIYFWQGSYYQVVIKIVWN